MVIVVPDYIVVCILSSLLNCQLLNLRFHQWTLCYSFSANCEQNVNDIRKYLGKRTQKEYQINLVVKSLIQRNHSVVQTRARCSWPALSLINYLHNRWRNATRKFGRKFILGFSVKILKLACFEPFVRNGEGHLQEQRVGGWQGELLTGTTPQNYWNSIVDLNGTKTHQSLHEWLSI